jgi:hypothetical protein
MAVGLACETAGMPSPQSLNEADRRLVASWAAACAERVLYLFEMEAPTDARPREAIARARAFAQGELDTAGEIRRRFVAGRAAHAVNSPAAVAAAQAAGVAHMGAHALGAAAYAAKAVGNSIRIHGAHIIVGSARVPEIGDQNES